MTAVPGCNGSTGGYYETDVLDAKSEVLYDTEQLPIGQLFSVQMTEAVGGPNALLQAHAGTRVLRGGHSWRATLEIGIASITWRLPALRLVLSLGLRPRVSGADEGVGRVLDRLPRDVAVTLEVVLLVLLVYVYRRVRLGLGLGLG